MANAAAIIEKTASTKPLCGIVMPISPIDGCSEDHWVDVREVLEEAIDKAGFLPNLVSHADDSGIIQKRIIQNLYDNPIVVCDVSGKNPNVMFELGMRLAFDKPTIVIKDDKTSYSFDTSPIEHLSYPRDLRYASIVEFKKNLTDKIMATHQRSSIDRNYTTFLKNFGKFTVAKLETEVVGKDDYIIEELKQIRTFLASPTSVRTRVERTRIPELCIRRTTPELTTKIANDLRDKLGVSDFFIKAQGENQSHVHFQFTGKSEVPYSKVLEVVKCHPVEARIT